MASISKLIDEVQLFSSVEDPLGNENQHHLLQAVRKLLLAVETPTQALRRIGFQPIQNSTLRLAVELGLAKIIMEDERVSLAVLTEKSGAGEELIVRIMRVLAAMDLCGEASEGVYTSTPLTHALASPTFHGGTKFTFDTLVPTSAKLIPFLKSHNFVPPEQGQECAFTHTFGMPLWGYLKQNPVLQQGMMDFMEGRQGGKRWVDVFPAEEVLGVLERKHNNEDESVENEDITGPVRIVDVGGNRGHDLVLFKEKFPSLEGRCVLMDLPAVVGQLEKEGGLSGIEILAYDIFTPQPIKGAQIYLYRAMLHCYSDSTCVRILRNVVSAMEPGYSRLLIVDPVIDSTGVPLHTALLDMMMLSQCGGLERTERQWRRLLEGIGLGVVRIWREEGADAVVECMVDV